MGCSENFCLTWNDFRENLTSSFSEQRSNPDFTDVTLACEDKGLLTAHRVILAASSLFFRDVLSKQKHPDLLIYMRGIKTKDLNCLLDFIYNGEVNIFQEDLDGFLAIAEELGLKGLTGVSTEEYMKHEETENRVQKLQNVKSKEEIKLSADGVSINNVPEYNFEEPSNPLRSMVVANESVDYKELDEQIMTMMEKREGIWTCKVCCKTDDKLNKKINIQQHVESLHVEGGAHPCNHCGKILRSRHTLRTHMKIHNK